MVSGTRTRFGVAMTSADKGMISLGEFFASLSMMRSALFAPSIALLKVTLVAICIPALIF